MKNIVLIGMPASGKSTVGVILAKMLAFSFIDTDILLALEQKRPLSQIISEDGYDRFIELEGGIGKELKCENTVIATGGSMVFSEEAMKNLSNNSVLVWLDATVSQLEQRLVGTLSDRGVATPEKMTMREIYDMREPLYRKFADIRLPCEDMTELVAQKLKNKLLDEKLI